MFGIGPMELVLILVVALLVFGPKRLPDLARTLGRGMGEFRRASNDLRQSLALDDLQKDLREGLSGENSIQRPAQAGDSLPDAEKAEESAADSSDAEMTDTSAANETGDTEDTSGGEETSEAAEAHPGELPLDNDYEHNEVSTESESADTPESAQSTQPAQPNQPTTGDSELGNIPVSRPAVGVRKPDSERG